MTDKNERRDYYEVSSISIASHYNHLKLKKYVFDFVEYSSSSRGSTTGCPSFYSSSSRLSHTISGYLSLGYSTPFLALGQSHMYPSLAAAKAGVIAVGEEIATLDFHPEFVR
jgi:hypothetical protein